MLIVLVALIGLSNQLPFAFFTNAYHSAGLVQVEIEKMEVEYFTNEFRNKCTSKELKPEDFHAKLEQKLPQYKARWKNSMNDQIKDLPDFEQVHSAQGFVMHQKAPGRRQPKVIAAPNNLGFCLR